MYSMFCFTSQLFCSSTELANKQKIIKSNEKETVLFYSDDE